MTSAKLVQALLLAGLVSPMGLVVGCQSAPPPSAPAPSPDAMEKQSMTMRDQFMRIDPNARVGVVQTVLAQDKWLAVGEAQVQNFNEGDWLSIFDPNGTLLAQGEIRKIVGQGLHVKYEPAPNASRSPQRGDFAMASQRGMMPASPTVVDPGMGMQSGMPMQQGMEAPMNNGGGMGAGQPGMGAGQPGMAPSADGAAPMPADGGQGQPAMPPANGAAAPEPAAPPPDAAAPADAPASQPPAPELNK